MIKFESHYTALTYYGIKSTASAEKTGAYNPNIKEHTVTRNNDRYTVKGEYTHLCTVTLPDDAIQVCKDKVIRATPEFAFLQVAKKLTYHQLCMLGMDLCSHSPSNPDKAITTKGKLTKFLDSVKRHHGLEKAKRVVKQLEDGSNSPMESYSYLLLTLPHRYGGYALKGFGLNVRVELEERIKSQTNGLGALHPDLCNNTKKVIIEYNSKEHHDNQTAYGKDAERNQWLQSMGYTVFVLTAILVCDKAKSINFVNNLCLAMKHKLRNRTKVKRFNEQHKGLRNCLPGHEGKAG